MGIGKTASRSSMAAVLAAERTKQFNPSLVSEVVRIGSGKSRGKGANY